MKKTLYYDLHLHTTYSDGRSPFEDVIRAAISNGLDCIALTDHIFPDSNLEWLDTIRQDVAKYQSDLLILIGAEACILNPEGDISVDTKIRSKLDILLVDFGFHTEKIFKNCTSKEQVLDDLTKAMCKLCDNPLVDIIAHPFNLGRTPMSLIPSDIPDETLHHIASKFAETTTVFEIMNTMPFWFPFLSVQKITTDYLHIVNVFKEHSVRFSIGSDAHSCCGVGNLKWCEKIVSAAKIENLLISPQKLIRRCKQLTIN